MAEDYRPSASTSHGGGESPSAKKGKERIVVEDSDDAPRHPDHPEKLYFDSGESSSNHEDLPSERESKINKKTEILRRRPWAAAATAPMPEWFRNKPKPLNELLDTLKDFGDPPEIPAEVFAQVYLSSLGWKAGMAIGRRYRNQNDDEAFVVDKDKCYDGVRGLGYRW